MGWRALASGGITRSDENSQSDPGRRPRFDVAHLVAHDRRASEVEAKVRRRLQDHSRIGFAPWMIRTIFADAVERMIRAMIHAGNRRAFCSKTIAHPTRQVRIDAFVEIAATDAGLVGDDNDRPAQLIGPEARQFEDSGDELELVGSMDVAVIHIDHTITVEKESAVRHGSCRFSIQPFRASIGRYFGFYNS